MTQMKKVYGILKDAVPRPLLWFKEESGNLKEGLSPSYFVQSSKSELGVRFKGVSSEEEDVGIPHPYFSNNFGWTKRAQEVLLFVRGCNDVDIVPEQARNLLNALSRSGVPNNRKIELVEKARRIWVGWKVNFDDIEFIRKPNGDRKRIGMGGAADVYLARMKLRDVNENIIAGKLTEVAVKQFTVLRSKAEGQFPLFIREVFLQKHAQHPCIVHTLGGY